MFFESESEDEEGRNTKISRRCFRDESNPLEICENDFVPLQPWLLTPYRNSVEGSAEIRLNNIHSVARSQIERTIGILKGRWRCLSNERKLRFDPEIATI